MRTDGIIRGLGGIYAGAFTTTQRDAIPAGFRPYGVAILNTSTNRWEWNSGTDASPLWIGLGGGGNVTKGTLAARPSPGISNANTFYFATDDNGGTLYSSDGSLWTKVSKGINEAPAAHGGTHHPQLGSDFVVMSLSGTIAQIPSAGVVAQGTLYYATDIRMTFRSSSGSWVPIAGALTAHTESSFTPGSAYGDIAGVSVTIPMNGVYTIEWGFEGYLSRPAREIRVAPNGAGLTASDAISAVFSDIGSSDNTSVTVVLTLRSSVARTLPSQNLTAGVLTLQHKGSGSGVDQNIWLRVTPG